MGQRLAAFLAAAIGGMIELFGAVGWQGVRGGGALFGLLGSETRTEAVLIGFVLGTATVVAAVTIMLRRDARAAAAVIAVCAVAGTLVAGQVYGIGALLALLGAVLATRLDRTRPLD
jgi:hypothetical protein